VRTEPAAIFAFDLLELRGKDLRALLLLKRKAPLEMLLRKSTRIPLTDACGRRRRRRATARAAAKLELEGIVAKRADAPYRPRLSAPDGSGDGIHRPRRHARK
jgi:bifunctional non-homologous end joining protein LigD